MSGPRQSRAILSTTWSRRYCVFIYRPRRKVTVCVNSEFRFCLWCHGVGVWRKPAGGRFRTSLKHASCQYPPSQLNRGARVRAPFLEEVFDIKTKKRAARKHQTEYDLEDDDEPQSFDFVVRDTLQ